MVGRHAGDYTNRYNAVNYTNSYFASYAWAMPKDLADALRDAIRKSGMTALELAQKTGVPQPTITRFLHGRDMRLSRAQKLAAYFGLELRPKR